MGEADTQRSTGLLMKVQCATLPEQVLKKIHADSYINHLTARFGRGFSEEPPALLNCVTTGSSFTGRQENVGGTNSRALMEILAGVFP